MRRLILAVMIVMLPLRGWIGDAMAMAAAGSTAAIYSIAEDDQLMLGSTGFDGNSSLLGLSGVTAHCPDHASFLDDSSDTEGEPSAHGQACTVCQVCHTVAMSAEAMAFATLSLPLIAPQASAPRFTSALPAPGLKPPIS